LQAGRPFRELTQCCSLNESQVLWNAPYLKDETFIIHYELLAVAVEGGLEAQHGEFPDPDSLHDFLPVSII